MNVNDLDKVISLVKNREIILKAIEQLCESISICEAERTHAITYSINRESRQINIGIVTLKLTFEAELKELEHQLESLGVYCDDEIEVNHVTR